MRPLLLLALVGCYSPKVHSGAPCGPGGECPDLLECSAANTCEPPGGVDAAIDSSGISDAPGPDACSTCIAPANDLPGGAIDITSGGDFTADLTYAHDDAQRPVQGSTSCGMDGGLDVFYKLSIPDDEVYYVDTFGSDFNTLIRVVHGACAGGVAANGTTCRNDAPCNSTLQTQYAGTMTAGDNCVIVDGYDGTQTGHSLKLHVERGHRTGSRISTNPPSGPYTESGNTTGGANVEDGSCSQHMAPDDGFYFVSCPGQTLTVTASTCNAVTEAAPWDTTVYSRGPAGQLACMDDDGANCALDGQLSSISFSAAGAHLFWVIVDGAGGTPSGAYQLDLNFQ